MSGDDPGLSAEERGETVPRWARVLIRVLAVAVFLGGTLAVALVREREHADETGSVAASPKPAAQADEAPALHAAREARLLASEDARLRAASLGEAVGATRMAGSLVLGARRAAYTIDDLVRAGAATRVSRSVVLVTEPVTVRRDARLVIHAPGTSLRLRSTPDGYASLVSWGGSIALSGARGRPLVVEGWDVAADASDGTTADGRAYVRVKDGELRVTHVELRHLGFWSGRTGGLSLTGSTDTTASGVLSDVAIQDLHIGLYVSGGRGVRMREVRVAGAQRHGIEVTNRSERVHLRGLVVRGAGEDAISVSNGSSHVAVEDAVLAGSGGYGLDVDGSPLADGPNSAGYGIGNYGWIELADARVTGNQAGGVRFQSVDHLEVHDIQVTARRSALVVRGASEDVTVGESRLASEDGPGLVLADGVREAHLTGSTVTGLAVGVAVEDSVATLEDNEITVGTGHGVQVSGAEAEATVTGNTIHGRGSSAVGASDGASVTGADDGSGEWTYRPEILMWAERNSAALPLLLVLVIPGIGLVFVLRRRRQQRQLRRVFEQTLVARGQSAIAAYRVEPALAAVGGEGAAAPDAGAEADVPGEAVTPGLPGDEDAELGDVAEQVPSAGGPGDHAVERRTGQGLVALTDREFGDAREFALAAVLEAGYSPSMVARVLHVPTSRVRTWVAGLDDQAPDRTESGGPS